MNHPTLIDLPPPPSEPITPEIPGTPNSGTTSLSAISTTAIKDGQTGFHGPGRRQHHHSGSTASQSSTNTLDAERADRISRLAGLERVTTARQPSNLSSSSAGVAFNVPDAPPSAQQQQQQQQQHPQAMGYFDSNGTPRLVAARSTVGSASATASIAGRTTTWTSGGSTTTEAEQEHDMASVSMSGPFEADQEQDNDKMSDVDAVSSAGLSDGGRESLVSFGEGANSTISGPVSAPRDPVQAARLRAAARLGNAGQVVPGQGTGMAGVERTGLSPGQQPASPYSNESFGMEGIETAERLARDRLRDREGGMRSPDDRGMGRFPFEER